MFKNSYQASLSANLMELLTKEAEQDRLFLAAQKDLFFTADEGAPIDLTTQELAQFETRKGITALRSEMKAAVGRQRTLLRDRCTAEIRALSSLLIESKRAQYFAQVDMNRAHGLPTDAIRTKALEERTVLGLTQSGAAIAQFLHCSDAKGHGTSNIRWVELLLDNLRGRGPGAAPTAAAGRLKFQCLLCEAPVTTSFSLTRHTAAVHEDQLLRPLKCPACARCGKDVEITGSQPWSIHCATSHGPEFTPKPIVKGLFCFCGAKLSASSFACHLNSTHAKHKGHISCKECEHSPTYRDIDEWLGHIQNHQPDSCRPFRRCLLCGKVCQAIHQHLTRTHKEQFEQPFRCPKCGQEVDGRDAWEAHVLDLHTTRRTPLTSDDNGYGPGAAEETSLLAMNGNDTHGSDDLFNTDMASDTESVNAKAWKLLGSLLSQTQSRG